MRHYDEKPVNGHRVELERADTETPWALEEDWERTELSVKTPMLDRGRHVGRESLGQYHTTNTPGKNGIDAGFKVALLAMVKDYGYRYEA